MEMKLLHNAEPCFGAVAAAEEKELFERLREELSSLLDSDKNYWKTAHHLRVSSMLLDTEMYLFPFRWDKCFGYHLYRWMLWLPLRSMFWRIFSPSEPPLSEETVKTIIDLLLPFEGFLPHTSIYDIQEYPLTKMRTPLPYRSRIPYNLSLLVVSDEIRLDREPYFLTPNIETKSLLLLLDIFDTMYYHTDPDLRHYHERFNYEEMYKKYIIQSTSLLYSEGAISADIAYHRVMNRVMKLTT